MKEIEMDNWIEINLPWYVYSNYNDMPPLPDLFDREREVFGTTIEENREAIKKSFDIYKEIKRKNLPEGSFASEEIREQMKEKYQDNPDVILVLNHFDLDDRINEWYDEQPEVLAFNKLNKIYEDKLDEKSFTGRKLNKPGTLIELADGAIHLIGSINSAAGVCDDCRAFTNDTIVKRYKVIYEWKKVND